MNKTACTQWLDTLTDSQLGNHSQTGLANEAWKRGAAYAAQTILNHLESIDTLKIGNLDVAMLVGLARVEADSFIKKVNK